MDNIKFEEVNLLNFQTIVTILYIGSLIVSIYITQNDKKNILENTNNDVNKVSISNRILVVLLTLCFLYISLKNRELANKKGKNIDLFNLQVTASLISLLSTIIVLYVVIKSCGENYTIISGVSNPNL